MGTQHTTIKHLHDVDADSQSCITENGDDWALFSCNLKESSGQLKLSCAAKSAGQIRFVGARCMQVTVNGD